LTADPELDAALPDGLTATIRACLRHDPDRRPEPAAVMAVLEQRLAALPQPWLSKLKPRRRR
jgi:hypothetical protein